MSAFSLFKRQSKPQITGEAAWKSVWSTEVNKYGWNNNALVLSVAVQRSAAENRWNFQYSQYPGPLHSTAQPPYSAFGSSLFLTFMAFSSNSATIHTSRNAYTCSFHTVWGTSKGSRSIFAMLKGELICLKGNEVCLLSSSPKGWQCCYVGQAPV